MFNEEMTANLKLAALMKHKLHYRRLYVVLGSMVDGSSPIRWVSD